MPKLGKLYQLRLRPVANGGFEIPVDFVTAVKSQGQSLQSFFQQVEKEGLEAVDRIAKAAGQPIKQVVEFEIKDGKMQQSLKETYAWTEKVEKAMAASAAKDVARKKKAAAESKRQADAAAAAAAKELAAQKKLSEQGTRFRKKQIAELEKIRKEHFKNIDSSKKVGKAGKKSGLAVVSGFIKAQIAMAAARVTLEQFGATLNASFDRANAEQRLKNITQSTAEYEQALRLAKLAAADFGVTQTDATVAMGDLYSRLGALGFGLTEVNEIYRGFNVIARESGVAAQDANGAFLQLSQGLGSGKLAGDELRAILERMPQLAALIAKEMNITAGAVKQAGADGKITGDIIYKALSQAAKSSTDLSSKLTVQQNTLNLAKQRAEELQVAMGRAFTPIYIEFLNRFSEGALLVVGALKGMQTMVEKNREQIEFLLKLGLEIGKIAASIFIVVKAYQAYKKAVQAVAAVKAALLAMTGIGIKAILAGAVAAGAVYLGLEKATEGASNAISTLKDEVQKETDETRRLAAERNDLFKGQLDAQEKIKENEATINEIIAQGNEKISERKQAIDNEMSLTSARIDAEMKINDVLLQQAQTRLDEAKNAEEKARVAKEIYDLTMIQAKLEYEMAMANIEASVRKAEVAAEELAIKKQLVQAEKALARARGESTAAYDKALESVSKALAMSREMLKTTQGVAEQQRRGAQAIFEGSEAAAKAAFEQNKVWKASEGAATAAGKFASNMQDGAKAAKEAAESTQDIAAAIKSGKKTTQTITAKQEAVDNVRANARGPMSWAEFTVALAKETKRIEERDRRQRIQDRIDQAYDKEKARAEKLILDTQEAFRARYEKTAITAEKAAKLGLKVSDDMRANTMVLNRVLSRIASQLAFTKAPPRAEGGPVAGGSTYQVNELGKEGFMTSSGRMSEIKVPAYGSWTAPSNGEVIPAHVWAELKAAKVASTAGAPAGLARASRGVSGGVSNVDNTRITNHVTIQSQSPVQTASELMVSSAKRRRSRFR